MKVYQSPLVIGATVLFCYAAYLFINAALHAENRGLLVVAPFLLIATTGIVVHFLFKKIIGTNTRIQFLIELALLFSVVLIVLVG